MLKLGYFFVVSFLGFFEFFAKLVDKALGFIFNDIAEFFDFEPQMVIDLMAIFDPLLQYLLLLPYKSLLQLVFRWRY